MVIFKEMLTPCKIQFLTRSESTFQKAMIVRGSLYDQDHLSCHHSSSCEGLSVGRVQWWSSILVGFTEHVSLSHYLPALGNEKRTPQMSSSVTTLFTVLRTAKRTCNYPSLADAD